MKQRTIITLAIVAGLMLFMFMWSRSCRASARLAEAKAEYREYRAINEEQARQMSIRLEGLNNEIAHKDNAIGQLESEVAAKKLEISAVKTELTELQNAEPVQPELEKEPLVINLRGQISKLTEMFTLATNTIALQNKEIDELKGKATLLEGVAAEWKGAYERERTLRVQAENLFKVCERGQRLNKFWKTTAIVATGAVTGLLLLK